MRGDFNKNPEPNWEPFWFEANSWFGWVNSKEMYKDLLSVYPDASTAKSANWKGGPKFGFRMECKGDQTLGEWMSND